MNTFNSDIRILFNRTSCATQGNSYEVFIIADECIECGQCVPVCPVEAIVYENTYVVKDSCVVCGKCFAECPVDAIYMMK